MIANYTLIPEKDRTILSKENNQIDSLVFMISNVKEIFEYFFYF